MTSAKSFEEIKELVEKWWRNLQFERKCSSSNLVQKVVNNCAPDIQEQVRLVIVDEIKKLLENCLTSKDLKDFQSTCNAINGCFDNFIHAVDALNLLFSEVLSFIDFGLSQCQEVQLSVRTNQKNTLLELLHSLSRILILVLKLRRSQNLGKVKGHAQRKNFQIEDLPNKENCKHLLSRLTYKIGRFLLLDDILIDTKNNLSMSGILIRELLASNEYDLIQFHRNFIQSIPTFLSDEEFKLNILKFLLSSAIINSWSLNIIDSDSTEIYLKFFISLCEKYSSETSIVLNTSRTLLLLIKHDSFKKFIENVNKEQVEPIIFRLLSCIFMLLEHPVPCVRHSAKDFLQLLALHPSLHAVMIKAVSSLPTDKRSYFISVGALAKEIGTEVLIENNNELPKQLIGAICDPTIVSHVSLALEFVILNDNLAKKNFSQWSETWIVPLLISLINVLPIVAADIEKLLEKAFKKYPESILYVIDRWANPTSGEELRCVVTALKISQKQGFKLKSKSNNEKAGESQDAEADLINENLLEHCLHQRDDDIRVSAFSLIIEAHKSTKPYSERDFRMIQYFLKYNLNNQQPSTRQKILGLIRKMLVRFSESKATFLKPSKNEEEQERKLKNCLLYDQFLDSLIFFCFSNIFLGCNFNRLNSVLNILLLCFENVKDMSFNREMTGFYWNKFLMALDSSYEENKALAVVLAHKLDLFLLEPNKPAVAKALYEKAFDLSTHMEPPDVLTGSYLLQVLTKLPSSKQVLSKYFIDELVLDDVYFCCIQVLLRKLKEQVQLAKLDLMTAATCGPMYGALFAIRLILRSVEFSQDVDRFACVEWGKIFQELVDLSFEMTRIVGCVVNSSSPEGHLPMDFQTNFDNLLSQTLSEKCNLKGSGDFVQPSGRNKTEHLIETICCSFFRKFRELQSRIETPDCDAYESLRSVNCLLKENQLLLREMEVLRNQKSLEVTKSGELLEELKNVKRKLELHAEKLEKMSAVTEWPATAQVLLLCAWRSIKEASLFLGDLVSKLPIETLIELGLISKSTIIRIGEELRILLCEIKHRGAFEQSFIGFTQLVNSLWKCADKNLSDLPRQWLEDIKDQLESPLKDQKVKLCVTRRSAGLPFLLQAIICSEIVSIKSTTPSTLHSTMNFLLRIIESGVEQNPEAKIHALNVLRALFKHAQLGEHVASYVSKALMVAIRGSRAESWSERNSSSLLFSSLIIRIFGVSRSREEISKKNRMTSRTFFQRYSELYDFFLSEMELVYSKENYVDGLYPKPSLYLVLLVLGRLYPPPTEDPDNIDLSEFLPYINMSRKNPTMKIRELGARALVPLIPLDRLLDELDDRFLELSSRVGITNNERHGILLQIKELLCQSPEAFENLFKFRRKFSWIENTKWMLECVNRIPLLILSSYVKVLHVLFKNFPVLRESISELITETSVAQELLKLTVPERSLLPGIYLFLENFYFLKADVLAQTNGLCERGMFSEFLISMLHCDISEIQSVPLRILRHVLRTNGTADSDDDDFNGISVPVAELLLFSSKESVRILHSELLNNREVLKYLTERVNSNGKEILSSAVIHRIWLTVVSDLVLNGVVPVSCSASTTSNFFLKIDFAKSLVNSGDKDLSTSAGICYALHLLEEVSQHKASTEDRLVLSDILHQFSRSDADLKERLAVAKILNRSCECFFEKSAMADPVVLSVWMIPFRLLADEDSEVRSAALELVHKMQTHILKELSPDRMIIKMKTLDWPHLPLISLKAQECLLDSYINILGLENLIYLLAQMMIMAVSSLGDFDESNAFSKDEFGVFEKGNPNPYCEDLALSDLMCRKIKELTTLEDVETLLRNDLNDALKAFIANSFRQTNSTPRNLMEVVETLITFTEKTKPSKGDFSLLRLQIKYLRDALSLPEAVYPKEYRYYEIILKRKCLRKLKDNVWEKKTKWILLEKADNHYRVTLLLKYLNFWLLYVNERYKKKINRKAAENFREKKLKSRGLNVLKRNVEQTRLLMRVYGKKFEWRLKHKCWHQWKHYTQKRVKVREIKLLADRIREERLRIRCFYLWSFRLREKRSLQDAYERAEMRHSKKLKEKYFKIWKTFKEKRVWKEKIWKLAEICYEDKLKERFIGRWKRYTFQRKRYRYQMKIIGDFYEGYLLKNYLNRWMVAYRKLKHERKARNHYLAMEHLNRKLLRKTFKILWTAKERKKEREEKMRKFQEIHAKVILSFYLKEWLQKKTEKLIFDHLEKKAKAWRKNYLREFVLRKLLEKYEERLEEKEEIANAIEYSNAALIRRAFHGWLEVAKAKVIKRTQLENAALFYFERITQKTFRCWKKYKVMRYKKKIAVGHYENVLLSRAVNGWKAFLCEQRKKQAKALNLEKRLNTRMVTKAFKIWKNEIDCAHSKLIVAVEFDEKSKLSRAFRAWKQTAKQKAARKSQFNRNKTILDGIAIKDVIFRWYEMHLFKVSLERTLNKFESRQNMRSMAFHFGRWFKFVQKMKTVEQRVRMFPQIRKSLLVEEYLILMSEAVSDRRALTRKSELAKRAQETMLKRKYFKNWLCFISWRREKLLKRLTEEEKCESKRLFELAMVPGKSVRRQPMIPDFLKIDPNMDSLQDSVNQETYRAEKTFNRKLPVI